MDRLSANKTILSIISDAIQANPDWRFHQVLQNLGIVKNGFDQWYEESDVTLKNMAYCMKTR